jgi:phage host-nuclease inhibitor protein Gam
MEEMMAERDRQEQYDLAQAEYYAVERGEETPFSIDNDSKADWSIRKIAAARADHARIVALAKEQITELEVKIEAEDARLRNATDWLTSQLAAYVETVPCKQTKTQSTYRLLSGTLKRKRGMEFRRDDDALVPWLRQTGKAELIKEEARWAELKKLLTFSDDGTALTTDGEVVPGVTAVRKPETFIVETEGLQ